MADTFTLYGASVALTATKSLLSLFNGSGSGVVIRVKRVEISNTQIAAVTGVQGQIELRAITNATSGSAVVPTKHVPTTVNLQAQVTCLTGATVTNATNSILSRTAWSSDEPAVGGATADEWQTITPWNVLFDATGDTRIQPLTLREGYGISVTTTSALTAGTADVRILFTRT